MFSLRADNRNLIKNAKYSFLRTNYLSGVNEMIVLNSEPFYTKLGDSTTQFDITNTAGNTYRYTYDGTGTNPYIESFIFTGLTVITNAQNFNAGNNDTLVVTGVGTNYFEVTNASGVAESNKTIGTGSLIVLPSHVMIGELNDKNSEVVTLGDITTSTYTLTFQSSATTKFAHPESTRVTVLSYNQVKFYQTAAATFSNSENPLGTIDLQLDNFYTLFNDFVNTDGYGWFVFYNSITAKVTENSNAIPYANFSESTTKKILDNFYSLLNDKERRQIDVDDAYGFLNEAVSIATGELNLINDSYKVSEETTVAITSGTSEYSLESDFSDIVNVYHGTTGDEIFYIDIKDVADWENNSASDTRYYLRGNYIGLTPEPTTSYSLKVRYKSLGAVLDTYDDLADLPDKSFYGLKMYMMFLACIKLGRTDGENFLKLFDVSIQRMKMVSHKRSNFLENWIPDRASMI